MKQPASTEADRASKANRPSMLLTNEENEQLFGLLGRRCQTQCTAVVQLYMTQSPAHASWVKKWTGALCFVKDNIRKSYYFRLYCLKANRQVWEQELYEKMEVTKPRPFLIVFEGAEGIVAFNFAMEDEATAFMNTTTTTLHNRNRRRDDRLKRNSTRKDPPPARPPPVSNQNNAFDNTVTLRHKPSFGAPTGGFPQQPAAAAMAPHQRPTKNKAKGRLRKEDIGMPSNFKHVTHVGWSPTSGFDLSGEEDTLKPFLEKAGVRDQHLKDRETREFIYDFIQNHKVLDTMKSEQSGNNRKQRPPPVPIRNHHEQQTQQQQSSPQQQPNGSVQQRNPPPPPPNRTLPPLPATTPPKVNQAPSRPPPIQQQHQHKESPAPPAPPVASIPGPPPPPPPPPSGGIAAPPPPPPMGSLPKAQAPTPIPVVDDNRSALLDSIRKGTTLKPVDQGALSTGSGSGGGSDPRGNLMSQIRGGGVVLRPVQDREQNAGPGTDRSSGSAGSGDCGTDALADALRRALAERGRVIRSSDEDDSDSNSANDDWDD